MANGRYSTPNYSDQQGGRFNVRGTQRVLPGGEVVYSTSAAEQYPVENGTTAADFVNFGHTHFGTTAAAKTYTLAKPGRAGLRKTLQCTAATTDAKQTVQTSTGGGVTIGASSNWKIIFDDVDGIGDGLELISRSTGKWDVIGGQNSTNISFST